jgi:maleylacetate reductase
VIVRWSIEALPATLAEVGIERPFLIASRRWAGLNRPHIAWLDEVPSAEFEVPEEADGILAAGGGSAIDTGKYASAQSGKPVVHIPTTYSGAEWTTHYGIRTPDRRMQGGGGGANPVALVYDVDLTLDLPIDVTVGTSLNGLAHCAEALYTKSRTLAGEEQALLGAPLIAGALPRVVANLRDREAREELLEGAAHAGHALSLAGLALAHAMAQAVGGAYGLPHGAMNALCLPPALRFNRAYAPDAVTRFGEAIGGEPVERARELALLGGFERLRDFGVPEDDLPRLAEAASQRPGNANNPEPAGPEEIVALFRAIW